MCVVSMISDYYRDRWDPRPWVVPYPDVYPLPFPGDNRPVRPEDLFPSIDMSKISREELEQLKRDVQEMKELLKRAKKYDEDTGQPDCQMDQKVALLRKIAEAVGVNLDDVFGETK